MVFYLGVNKVNYELEWIDTVWEAVTEKVSRTSKRIGATFPHVSIDGVYNSENASWWTNGFWPGILWLVYRETKEKILSETASEVEAKLDEILYDIERQDHDMGFRWLLSSVAHYKLLNRTDSKRRGLMAANLLAGRFNLKGNFIRAFDAPGREGVVIIDTLMNLPLLYWAAEITGDPRFKWIAIAHTDMVLRAFIRPDGSVHHVLRFDPETGERIEALGGQGYAPDSAWSRGASWAVHGLALAYRYTGESRFLEGAKSAAHYFLAALPENHVPYWDFRAPVTENMPLDTSAGACAASGLMELSRLVGEHEQTMYKNEAIQLLKALYENYKGSESEEAILLMATGNVPAKKHINIPIIYGDYFFIEALSKLKGHDGLF